MDLPIRDLHFFLDNFPFFGRHFYRMENWHFDRHLFLENALLWADVSRAPESFGQQKIYQPEKTLRSIRKQNMDRGIFQIDSFDILKR